jgi:hypothetical protein
VTPLRIIGFSGFAEVEEQATDATCRTFVTFNLAYPAKGTLRAALASSAR